jgi:tetratricopeptide (TPR) repeat protein
MKKITVLVGLIAFFGFSKLLAQDYGNKVDPLKLCIAIQSNNFISDAEAENALDRILSVIGASKRFVLQPCENIDNAVAVSYKGVRYILYDKEFMNSVSSGNNWSNLFILAHEVGHHINGHSLDLVLYATEAVEAGTLESRREQELEADEFAGFILGKLGASLQQTNLAVNLLATNSNDTYSSHPSKSKRLSSISIGYNKASGNDNKFETLSKKESADEYFYKGLEKAKRKDRYGAIADYTKAIELNPNYYLYYYNRGVSKDKLNNFYGAMEDFSKAIELNPDYSPAYVNRGNIKDYFLKDYYGSISDHSRAIEIDPDYVLAYINRGVSKGNLKDFYGSITDLDKAIELDRNEEDAYLHRSYSKVGLRDYYGAIADLTKVIELNPDFGDAYYNRGSAKYSLGDKVGACSDGKKAKELGVDIPTLINKSCY